MSELERLHEIVDALPPEQVRALLTILEASQPVSDEELARRVREAPKEEADEETTLRILAGEAEQGDNISHDELKRRLRL